MQPDLLVPGAGDREQLHAELSAVRQELFADLKFDYSNSDGKKITLTLDDVAERLFDLSFDPNHPPELRWGAKGKELTTAPREQKRFYANYEAQQPWRNQLERRVGEMAPTDDDNPRTPPPHDIDTMTEKIAPEKTKPRWRLFHRLRKRD